MYDVLCSVELSSVESPRTIAFMYTIPPLMAILPFRECDHPVLLLFFLLGILYVGAKVCPERMSLAMTS